MKEVQHWNCEHCNLYNDILTDHCRDCHADKPNSITCYCQALVEIERGIYFNYGVLGYVDMHQYDASKVIAMTDDEKKFKQFFADETIFVKDMDIIQLREHRKELADIAFEAKAKTVATDEKIKEITSKTKNKQFILSDNHIPSDSDLINVPKVRASRMSKIDKMRNDLSKYLDKATVDEMIAKMEKKATEETIKTVTFAEVKQTPAANPFLANKSSIEVTETKPDSTAAAEAEVSSDEVKPNPFAAFAKKA